MRRYLVLSFCFLLISLAAFSAKFVMIPVDKTNSLISLFDNNNLNIHYYCDDYVLATTDYYLDGAIVLDDEAFVDMISYSVVYCDEDLKADYLIRSADNSKMLFSGKDFLIVKITSKDFVPAKNDGMIAITKDMKSRLLKNTTKIATEFPVITETSEDILGYLSEVSTERMMEVIQRLQDFGTRHCEHDSSIVAQNWIKSQYDELGLEVFLHDFPLYGNNDNSSDNVIAIQYGTEFPDEYIVCGCHYDSFCNPCDSNEAPGADDNATGVAGILETARILSQYEFKRSIIYCSFSAEELGLHGSRHYADKCASEGVNILGYFNIDMSGYLHSGTEPHIALIHPNSAQPLANYYYNICNLYLPDISVERIVFTSGDSDHTSFNNNGYYGIYPFEDEQYYSPYIHTNEDTIGVSVNSPELIKIFTTANIASIATLASYDKILLPIAPPTNCTADYNGNNRSIGVSWDAPTENSPLGYHIYRNYIKITSQIVTDLTYTDEVEHDDNYCYRITAVYTNEESGFSNESCVFVSAGIESTDFSVAIYPNPANDKICIKGNIVNEKAVIYNTKGKEIMNILVNSEIIYIDISKLKKGVYLIKISDNFVGRFVKE